MENSESILMEQLATQKISRTLLKKASAAIAHMQKAGFKVEEGFPIGRFGPDRFVLKGHIAAEQTKSLFDLALVPDVRRVEFLINGVIRDDIYRVSVEVGNKQQFS